MIGFHDDDALATFSPTFNFSVVLDAFEWKPWRWIVEAPVDIVGLAVKEDIFVKTIQPSSVSEVLGANSPEELYELKKAYNKISANALVSKAVKFADIDRLDFRGEIKIGSNTLAIAHTMIGMSQKNVFKARNIKKMMPRKF